jgi:hypothetical protein
LERSNVRESPLARELVFVMTSPVGRTTAGYPYLPEPAWTRFRDWVPHTLAFGDAVLEAAALVLSTARELGADEAALANLEAAQQVVQQVVFTAAVTAPPDLWLLRHVLGAFSKLGLSERLLAGETLHPDRCTPLRGEELRVDLLFLLGRGLLLVAPDGYRLADHAAARRAFSEIRPLDETLGEGAPSALAEAWRATFSGEADADTRALLLRAIGGELPTPTREPGRWSAVPTEIELGFRLVPLVLGLRAAGRIVGLVEAGRAGPADLVPDDAELDAAARRVFEAAGLSAADGALTVVGRRVLERGPGPFGIIETYHAYLGQLPEILEKGRGAVWVSRTANVAASQDANRRTFERANAALDRFCADSGFSYGVFIEHALGKGEATRQRFEASGDETIRYVGADLEDAAIDAAEGERDAGRLPAGMRFVRAADIGKPELLLAGLTAADLEPEGAVMMVGNGFHEVRGQTDERMRAVFEGYEAAGIIIIFTEETGLSVDDLLETAWNTYHAGFKYVHQRSGQGLRPAVPRPPSALEGDMPASWSECAERAGYVRLDGYSTRSRTVYPYTPTTGHNPAISVIHFCVPRRVAERLGLA